MDSSAGIRPYVKNQYYWQYKDKPVLLLGGTDDDNVFNWPDSDDVRAHLELLASVGGNYDRCVVSSRDAGNVKPFRLLENGRYDLRQWNPAFWERFDFYLQSCHQLGIIVQVEIWATYDIGSVDSPFNPANNVNLDGATSRLRYADDEKATRRLFYTSVPALDNDAELLQYQRAFVDKVLAHTLPYDNILYCIDNEYNFDMPLAWYRYWAEYIQEKATQAGKTIEITQMNQIDWPVLEKSRRGEPLDEADKERLGGDWSYLFTINHREIYDHPETYSYIDAGNGTSNSSPTEHWDNLQDIRRYIAEHPRPINHDKIYGADYGRIWTTQEGINKFWRNLIGGSASVRFHRPSSGIGLSPRAQASIRAARKFESLIQPWTCAPRMDVIAGCGDNTAYVMARPPEIYGVYLPGNVSGDVWVKLITRPGRYDVQWINIGTGEWGETAKGILGKRWIILAPPPFESGYGWAVIVREA